MFMQETPDQADGDELKTEGTDNGSPRARHCILGHMSAYENQYQRGDALTDKPAHKQSQHGFGFPIFLR